MLTIKTTYFLRLVMLKKGEWRMRKLCKTLIAAQFVLAGMVFLQIRCAHGLSTRRLIAQAYGVPVSVVFSSNYGGFRFATGTLILIA